MIEQKQLLVTGCHRSGTTLLGSLLGRHRDISMLNEDYTDGWTKAIGVKYCGVKMPMPTVLHDKKYPRFVVEFKRKWLRVRRWLGVRTHYKGVCSYSVADILDRGGYVVFSARYIEDNIASILNRTTQTRRSAYNDVVYSWDLLSSFRNHPRFIVVDFETLVEYPDKVLEYAVCERLGIEFEPEMLDGFKYQRTYDRDKIG